MSLGEFRCSVLNYTEKKILTWFFYSEERYNDFLNGSICLQGNGVYSLEEVIEINRMDDNRLIIIQKDGITTERYKFVTLSKTTIKYKDSAGLKPVTKTLTFRIRENVYGAQFNYFEEGGLSIDFGSIDKIKEYLSKTFGSYKSTAWNLVVKSKK
jgi:hypothetical protein